MTDEELIEQVARAIWEQQCQHWGHYRDKIPELCGWNELTESKQREVMREAHAALAAINLPAQLEAARTQGWNEAIEAAAEAFEAEAATWLQLPARGSCLRLGAKAIRALTKEKDDETR